MRIGEVINHTESAGAGHQIPPTHLPTANTNLHTSPLSHLLGPFHLFLPLLLAFSPSAPSRALSGAGLLVQNSRVHPLPLDTHTTSTPSVSSTPLMQIQPKPSSDRGKCCTPFINKFSRSTAVRLTCIRVHSSQLAKNTHSYAHTQHTRTHKQLPPVCLARSISSASSPRLSVSSRDLIVRREQLQTVETIQLFSYSACTRAKPTHHLKQLKL